MPDLFRNDSPNALTRDQAVALEKERLAARGLAPAPSNPEHVNAFFAAHHDRIAALADEMGVPTNFLMGLAAGESGWGRTSGNNLFGFSAKERPVAYETPDAAIDAFRKSQWYSRLKGKTEPSDFINELLSERDGRKKFNSVNPDYGEFVGSLIDTVNRRLPKWEQSR